MNQKAYRKAINSDGPEPKIKLKPEDRSLWNGFVDFMEKSGMKGNPELDNRDKNLSREMWDKYNKQKGSAVPYDEFIPQVQEFISAYRNRAIEHARAGKTVIPGLVDYTNPSQKVDLGDDALQEQFMNGLSKVDGWAGSKTTSWRFPNEYMLDPKTMKPTNMPNSIYSDLGVPVAPPIVSPQRFSSAIRKR